MKKYLTIAELSERVTIHKLSVSKDAFAGHRALAGWVERTGYEGMSHLEILAYNPKTRTITWKVKGSNQWACIGQSAYSPTEVVVAELFPVHKRWVCPLTTDRESYRVRVLLEYSVRVPRGGRK